MGEGMKIRALAGSVAVEASLEIEPVVGRVIRSRQQGRAGEGPARGVV